MRHAVHHIGRIAVRGGSARREAASLVDGDVDQHRAGAHRGDHLLADELRRRGAGDQHGTDDDIGCGDLALERIGGGGDHAHLAAEARIEFAQPRQRLVEDGDGGAHTVRDFRSRRAGHTAADDEHAGGRGARYAAHQDAGAAGVLLQKVRRDLRRHATGDFAHRRQQRQAAVAADHGFIGHRMRARLHERFGLRLVGGEVQIGEEHLPRAQHRALGQLRLFHLHDHVGRREYGSGRRQDLRTGSAVFVIGATDTEAGTRLDEHLVAGVDELTDRAGDEPHAVLVHLDLFGYADFHAIRMRHAGSQGLADSRCRMLESTISCD